jgi:adenosine kinase
VTYRIPPARLRSEAIDPTGVGDAFRAGLLAARRRGLPWEVAGRAGSIAAVFALESLGPQPRRYTLREFVARYAENFGTEGRNAGIGVLADSRNA